MATRQDDAKAMHQVESYRELAIGNREWLEVGIWELGIYERSNGGRLRCSVVSDQKSNCALILKKRADMICSGSRYVDRGVEFGGE